MILIGPPVQPTPKDLPGEETSAGLAYPALVDEETSVGTRAFSKREEAVRWNAEGFAMGSSWRLVGMGDDQRVEELQELVEVTLEQNEQRFSNWRRDRRRR